MRVTPYWWTSDHPIYRMQISSVCSKTLLGVDAFAYIPLLSAFLISRVTLSPTFNCISSYSLILTLIVGESPDAIPAEPWPPNILDMALGKFFIKSSGDVKAPTPMPKGLCGKLLPVPPPAVGAFDV